MTQFQPNLLSAYQLFQAGTLAFCRAEQAGIRIDMDYCQQETNRLSTLILELESNFYDSQFFKDWKKAFGIKKVNIYSNTQLSTYLYDVKKLSPTKKTVSGKGSSDEDALSQLNIIEVNNLLRIRKLKKLRDTYLAGFIREQINGYIHPSFNLHLVRTFRSSSDSPNFQNIPKRDKEAMKIIRKALFARPDHQLMSVDFSGLEVCIAACYHKDSTMLKYIKDPTTDMHSDMASQIFKIKKFDRNIPEHKILRNATKNGFVFPQFYGDYYKNCAINLANGWGKLPEGKWKSGDGIPMPGGISLADHFISQGIKTFDAFVYHIQQIEDDFWQNRFPIYKRWKEKWWSAYQKKGYIDSLTGFRCSGVMGKNDCINYPVQGSAFHCLLWSFIRLDSILTKNKMDSRIIGQIHDEIILDIHPSEKEIIQTIILNVLTVELPKYWEWIIVPLNVEMEVGKINGSWDEMSPIK
jgi:DNA polymerase-1